MNIKFYDAKEFVERIESSGLPPFVGNYASYARLCLGEIMPEDMKKILYLDSDTMIKDDISGFYDSEIDGKICLGVWDIIDEKYYTKNGIAPEHFYINSGVLLINLEEWKKHFSEDSIMKNSDVPNLDMPDQDIINVTLFRLGAKDYVAPMKYNLLMPFLEWDFDSVRKIFPVLDEKYYSREEFEESVRHPAIVHIVDGFNGRPWHKGNTNPLTPEWLSCLKESEFYADFVPFEPSEIRFLLRAKVWIYRNLPPALSLLVIMLYKKLKHIFSRR